jgi:diaminohydroxyphosphoribosylaminopyrimidine deaminase/5-amino-6-(5-phosphoribosylamino)uracil reductase
MQQDEIYMKRCLELAALGLGKTYPNPMVGSVIVHNGKIIGEGWHKKAGEAHAEVNAVNSVQNKALLKEATIYVSLEPCAHYGKTPPCASLIIKHQIPRVVIGCIDTFSEVSGKGIAMMEETGAVIKLGVLEKECIESHKRFFTFHQNKRPYIILKWAETKDGFIAPIAQEIGNPFWITSSKSKQLVHKWRTEEASILVGTNTADKDNPALTARLWNGNQPTRIVLDRRIRLSKDLKCFDANSTTLVFTELNEKSTPTTEYIKVDFNSLTLELLKKLYQKNIQSIIIEGGKQTLQTFIDLNLWDEARVFVGSSNLVTGIASPVFEQKSKREENIASDVLKWYCNSEPQTSLKK